MHNQSKPMIQTDNSKAVLWFKNLSVTPPFPISLLWIQIAICFHRLRFHRFFFSSTLISSPLISSPLTSSPLVSSPLILSPLISLLLYWRLRFHNICVPFPFRIVLWDLIYFILDQMVFRWKLRLIFCILLFLRHEKRKVLKGKLSNLEH
jgi:hypothetical protein